MSLKPEIIYESSLMANTSYEDIIKLAQIYTVGKDITDHMCELIEKEVIANQSHYLKLLETAEPIPNPKDPDGSTFPYPLKPTGMKDDTYAYNIIVECLRDPDSAEEYVGVGYDYDKIIEHSKTLKTITEEKKTAAKLVKPLTEEERMKLPQFQRMKLVLFEYEPCDEIKLMIVTHIENRNGGLSEELKAVKEKLTNNIKNFEAEFKLAKKESKRQEKIIESWGKLSDELCSFFLKSETINISDSIKNKFENGYSHTEPDGKKITLKAKFENGHITVNDGKSEDDRMSVYIRRSNSTIPPTLHISFRGTEEDYLGKYIRHDYVNMRNHYKKMRPIIEEIIAQELENHKKIYKDIPLSINWSGHSLGAACASEALKDHKDSDSIKNTGAFFGMPEIIYTKWEAANEFGTGLYSVVSNWTSNHKSKMNKFMTLGAETIINSDKNFNPVVDPRGIAINQAGDIITSSRRTNEDREKQLTYPSINVYKEGNRYHLKHHSAPDYAIITKNLLETFTLHNFVNDIKNGNSNINNYQEYYVGNLSTLISESNKKNVLDRLSNLRQSTINNSSVKKGLNP